MDKEELDDSRFTVLGQIETETAYDLYRDDGTDPRPVLAEHLTKAVIPASAAACSPVPGVAISSLVL